MCMDASPPEEKLKDVRVSVRAASVQYSNADECEQSNRSFLRDAQKSELQIAAQLQ